MLELILGYFLIVIIAALAGLVGARAWDYRPARIFVVTCAILLLVLLFANLREVTLDPSSALMLSIFNLVGISLLTMMLFLLLAAMFSPLWYEGRAPIVWMVLPYLLATLLLLIDGLAGTGLVVNGVRMTDNGFRTRFATPGSSVMLGLFVLAWLPHLTVLGVAFFQQPLARKSIGLLFLILIGALITSSFGAGGILQSLMIVGAFGYIVLRTRLLLPTRVGVDLAAYAMEDALIIRDMQGAITFINPAAERLGLHSTEALALNSASTTERHAQVAGHTLVVRQQPLVAPSGKPIGTLLLARDVTAIEQREQQLEVERARLTETVARLTETQQERTTLAQTVQQLTMPVIPVLPGVRIIPLVGVFDGLRSTQLGELVLENIEHTRAHLIVLDLTGVLQIDGAGAQGLLRIVYAAKLLGARCILVGIHPQIAQALIKLNLTLSDFETTATLEQAVQQVIAQASARLRLIGQA